MRQVFYILSIFLLGVVNLSFGQGYRHNYSVKNVKKLKKSNDVNAGKIHIKTKFNEKEDIHIFLINRTDSLLRPFLGHSENIKFKKEALDENGNWKPIDHYQKPRNKFICGMGMQYLKLEPDHYTWRKFLKTDYSGSFSTSIRFSYNLKDSLVIVSKPVPAKINYDLFLPYHERQILRLDSVLSLDTISQKRIYKLLYIKSRLNYKYNSIEKTVKVTQEGVIKYPEWIVGKYKLSNYLLRYAGKNRKILGEFEYHLIISKSMSLWEQIPKEHKKIYELSQKKLKSFTKLILTKSEWLHQNETPYKKIGSDYYAKLPLLDGELVKIKFRI